MKLDDSQGPVNQMVKLRIIWKRNTVRIAMAGESDAESKP
jgi:hypothetical protein